MTVVRISTGHSTTGFKVIDTATHSCNTCKSLLKMGTCGNGNPPLSIERELAAANDELLKGVNRQPFALLSREIQVYLTHSMHHKNPQQQTHLRLPEKHSCKVGGHRSRLEAIPSRLEATASRSEATAIRVEQNSKTSHFSPSHHPKSSKLCHPPHKAYEPTGREAHQDQRRNEEPALGCQPALGEQTLEHDSTARKSIIDSPTPFI